ncbi:MAG: hypothetical protein V3R54_03220, partial [Thermodesulfovibrionia bacterium]
YAHWSSKFLAFSNENENLNYDLRIEKFLNHLKTQKDIADWQVKQAEEALRLYVHSFLDENKTALYPNAPQTDKKPFDVSKTISELPCGRDRRASENCIFVFSVIPACRESFRLVRDHKKDSGQARMTENWNCGKDRRVLNLS